MAGDAAALGAGPAAPGDYSGTNTQEEGVDEADIVETDGEYLYVLSGGRLLIVDAWPAQQISVGDPIDIEGAAAAMYLHNDRLTVLSSSSPQWWLQPMDLRVLDFAGGHNYWRHDPHVNVTVFDVSDPTAVEIVEETHLDGSLVSSRMIDDRLYLILRNDGILDGPVWALDEQTGEYTYEAEAAYRQRLADLLADWMPEYTSVIDGPDGQVEQTGSLVVGSNVFIPDDKSGQEILSVVAFDVADDEVGPSTSTTVAGVTGQVYASTESLYIVSASHSWRPVFGILDAANLSHIYKFDLTADDVPLSATGTVPGHVLNSFSMDEEDGTFRIATNEWAGERSNNVFVLEQRGEELQVVGSLMNLALTERIYSARFMGDTAYLVTFRQVDPLFAIDLSDPTAPVVAGELKIPGYSAYLHPLGEDHLMGFGRDADDTGRVRGMQLSLFDVSDLTNPVRRDVYLFEDQDWWENSEALYDHHAFSFFPAYDLLALPIQIGWSEFSMTAFTVTGDDGIELLGKVNHDSRVRRSVRIGQYLYSVSESAVKVSRIDDVETVGGSVPLPGADLGGPIYFGGDPAIR